MFDEAKITILNVNDDEPSRYLVTRLLSRAGYKVEEAATGREALERARTSGADLVVLDVRLPDLSGYEVCRRLKADPETSSVLVLHTSATFVSAEKKVHGLELGADGYLTQPFEAIELIATVKALLRARQAEERAREAAREWQATFDGISDGVCLVDAKGRIRRHNAAFTRLLETPLSPVDGELAQALLEDVLDGRSHPELAAALRGEGRDSLEARVGPRWLRLCVDPLGPGKGRVVVLSDITEQKRGDEERKEADRRKDEFLAMLAHELRNPLNAISTSIYVQNAIGPQDPQNVRLRAAVSRQTRHLARLVDDLLDVSRITRGKILLKKEPTDLSAVIHRAAETCRLLIESRRHALKLDLPENPVVASVDAMRIEQVIVNLLNNAAKYAMPGGNISISLEVARGDGPPSALIRVKDDGVGIKPDMLESIFELFTQEDQSLARSSGGLGIGLTMARGLVQLHGGDVTAHSEGRGKGAEFRVTLPLTAQAAAEASRASGRAASKEGPLRILVVEDNPDTLEMMHSILELEGHHVESASDGVAGLELALAMRPDVALVDLGLPGLDGFQLAARLRAEPAGRNIYLVAVTGYGRPEDRQRALAAGFDAHVVKPVDPLELLAMIVRERGAKRPSPETDRPLSGLS